MSEYINHKYIDFYENLLKYVKLRICCTKSRLKVLIKKLFDFLLIKIMYLRIDKKLDI